jgi:hypothetical protein
MEIAWCWRCKKDVPMIEESEWRALWTGAADQAVMHECQQLTGLPPTLTTRKLMLSHRRCNYGPPCPSCGKLFRSPKAAFCAACGNKGVDA